MFQSNYYNKYLKYKKKYLEMKGGSAAATNMVERPIEEEERSHIMHDIERLESELRSLEAQKNQPLDDKKLGSLNERIAYIKQTIINLKARIAKNEELLDTSSIDNSETESNTIHVAIKNNVSDKFLLLLLSKGAKPINKEDNKLTVLNTIILSKNKEYLFILYIHFKEKQEDLVFPLDFNYTKEHVDIFKCLLALHIIKDNDIINIFARENQKHFGTAAIKKILDIGDVKVRKIELQKMFDLHDDYPIMYGADSKILESIDKVILEIIPVYYQKLMGAIRLDESMLKLLDIFIKMIIFKKPDLSLETKFELKHHILLGSNLYTKDDVDKLETEPDAVNELNIELLRAELLSTELLRAELNKLLLDFNRYVKETIGCSAIPDVNFEHESKVFQICAEYYGVNKLKSYWTDYFTDGDIYVVIRGLELAPLSRSKHMTTSEHYRQHIEGSLKFVEREFYFSFIDNDIIEHFVEYIMSVVFPVEKRPSLDYGNQAIESKESLEP